MKETCVDFIGNTFVGIFGRYPLITNVEIGGRIIPKKKSRDLVEESQDKFLQRSLDSLKVCQKKS